MDKSLMAAPEDIEARVAALEVLVLALLFQTSRANNLTAPDFASLVGAEPPQCQPLLEQRVSNHLGRALVRLETLLALAPKLAEAILAMRANLRVLERPEQRQAFDEFFLHATDEESAEMLLDSMKAALQSRKKTTGDGPPES